LSTERGDSEQAIPAQIGVPTLRIPKIRQVHGTRVVNAEDLGDDCEADAVISRTPGLACRVVTADCLPLLLSNRTGTTVAAIHAGWRGLAEGVIEATVDALDSAASEILVWIGPAISQPCYEVGRDVFEAFGCDVDVESRACFEDRGDRYLADLPALARLRLLRMGALAVTASGLCTYSAAARFHSYRREGRAAGRQAAVICIRP
jgi:YfiH family protein